MSEHAVVSATLKGQITTGNSNNQVKAPAYAAPALAFAA